MRPRQKFKLTRQGGLLGEIMMTISLTFYTYIGLLTREIMEIDV
jgi:hypothetical protein